MLPRCGGPRRRPANLRGREEGSLQLGCLLPGLPGRLLCLCPPSPPAAAPPQPRTRAGALMDGEREERSGRRRELGGVGDMRGGGRVLGSTPGKPSGGGAGSLWNCLDGRARPGRARGGPGSTQHAPSPGGREQRPAAASSRPVPPVATNQSEAGWAGSRERLLLRLGGGRALPGRSPGVPG